MDGLELCRLFRQMPRVGYGYFILLTSKTEKQAGTTASAIVMLWAGGLTDKFRVRTLAPIVFVALT